MAETTINEPARPPSPHPFGSYLLAAPPGSWLEPFRVERVTGKTGGRYGHSVERERIPLFRSVLLEDGREAVQLWRGMRVLARAARKAQGISAPETQPTLRPLRQAAPSRAVDLGLVRFIEQNECGLIRPDLSKNVDVTFLIAQVALAFPDAKIIIIVPDWARGWQEGLLRYIPEVGLSTYKSLYWGECRVVVSTPGSLGTISIGEADIVFVTAPLTRMRDDPLLVKVPIDPPTPETRYTINQMEKLADVRGRLFAFLPRHFNLSPYEAARLAQVFSVTEYVVAGLGLTERSVRVIWEKLTGGPAPSTNNSPLEMKQIAIWSNPILARRAANLAQTLSVGDPVKLRERFPIVARGLQREGVQRVLVLVEGKDHAEYLSRHLRGWLVVDAQEPGMPKSMAQRSPGVIATALGAERLQGDTFDVLVRLDLGVGLLPLPLPGWLDIAAADPRPLLLIDFDARCHPLLRQWCNSRRAVYLSAGWHDPEQHPDAAALARFIEQTSSRRTR